jgi:predicted nucleic acid-binding protein
MSTEKVFVDANILFSVAYAESSLDHLWKLSKKGVCVLLASNYVIEEAKRNLTTPTQLNKLDACLSTVQIVLEADPELSCPINLPEKDRPVLMSAISAKANYFLTGDIAHFGKYFGKTIMGVKILLARDYLRKELWRSGTSVKL